MMVDRSFLWEFSSPSLGKSLIPFFFFLLFFLPAFFFPYSGTKIGGIFGIFFLFFFFFLIPQFPLGDVVIELSFPAFFFSPFPFSHDSALEPFFSRQWRRGNGWGIPSPSLTSELEDWAFSSPLFLFGLESPPFPFGPFCRG